MSTETRTKLLRRIAMPTLAASWLGVVLGSVALIFSLGRPKIGQDKLYAISGPHGEWVALITIFTSLLILMTFGTLGSSLPAYQKLRAEMRMRSYSWPARLIGGLGLVLGILLLTGILPTPKLVHLSQGKWFADSFFKGSSQISATLAAIYLWRDLTVDSVLVVAATSQVAWLSRRLLRSIRLPSE